jgi:hypothetical protein
MEQAVMSESSSSASKEVSANSAPINPGEIRLRVRDSSHQGEDGPENTIQDQPLPTEKHDSFAKKLGFESYLALFEASTPLKTSAEAKWLTTAMKNQLWVVWNAANLQVAGTYPSQEEAVRSLEGDRA